MMNRYTGRKISDFAVTLGSGRRIALAAYARAWRAAIEAVRDGSTVQFPDVHEWPGSTCTAAEFRRAMVSGLHDRLAANLPGGSGSRALRRAERMLAAARVAEETLDPESPWLQPGDLFSYRGARWFFDAVNERGRRRMAA